MKLSVVTLYVPDRCKTKEMCYKVFLANGEMLRFMNDCYKNENMYD